MPKFVIVGLEFEPAHQLFSEVFENDDVVFVRNQLGDPDRITTRALLKMVRRGPVPKKILRILFRRLFSFPADEEVIFIYTNPWIEVSLESGLLDLLKEHYDNCYHAVLLLDVHAARKLDIESIKRGFDAVTIYDENEAKSLGVSYLPAMFSRSPLFDPSASIEYDLSFVGQAKERYSELMKVYDRLSHAGLRCHFYIVGVPESGRKYGEGLSYGDDFLSPEESLSYLMSSKCLLEIQLHETEALTARVREAIIYDKKLLTNNQRIRELPYYRSDMIQIYENADSIDLSFFESEGGTFEYCDEYSPIRYLKSVYELCKRSE